MFKGFYNLTSAMLTHGRHLDVISNNMANVATTGYKSDTFTATTFEDVLWSRVGNKDKSYVDIGNQSYITVPSENYTDYSVASYDETGEALDFAIEGNENCYFAFNGRNGRVYSRAGAFSLDNEGFLTLPAVGRVLDAAGNEIYVRTDKIHGDSYGGIYTDDGTFLGRLGVYRFPEDAQPIKDGDALFVPAGQEPEPVQGEVRVINGLLERSNVDLVQQMVRMISEQRAYQSAAQVSKMYDELMTKATGDLGRM